MLPTRLYKYQSLSARSLANLKSHAIWFASPPSFNDPLDCALEVIKPDLSEPEVERILAFHRTKHGIAAELEVQLAVGGEKRAEAKKALIRASIDAFSAERTRILRSRGVACFSECVDDVLMWSHYADGHRGFCLEFATDGLPFNNARRVIYVAEIPTLSVPDLLEGKTGEELLEALVLTKDEKWTYEKEWRAFSGNPDVSVNYDYRLLTGLYLGAAMSAEHRDVIGQLLLNSPTQLHQMEVESRSFKLTPNPVRYRPFPYR